MSHLIKFFTPLFFFAITTICNAQDLSFGKSTFNLSGLPEQMVTPELKVQNTGTANVEVFVNRVHQNLPSNWTSCYCYINCHPPTLDSLRFTLMPGETATIGIGFNTNTVEGIGFVKLTVEQIGGLQKDTLSFSGSTIASAIKEVEQSHIFNIFPNPSANEVTFISAANETYSLNLYNTNGLLIASFANLNEQKHITHLESFQSGTYIVKAIYQSGKSYSQKIIKN